MAPCENIFSLPSGCYALFFSVYDQSNEYTKPILLPSLSIIALYHDRQNPEDPIFPKVQEECKEFYNQLRRDVLSQNHHNHTVYEYHLDHIRQCQEEGEKRVRAVQTGNVRWEEGARIAEYYILRRQGGHGSSLGEFRLPFSAN